MTHGLDIVYGSTTIDIGTTLAEYVPLMNPGILDDPEAFVDEIAEVNSLSQANVQAIQLAFSQAWLRNKRKFGDRVFLNYQPGSTGDTYRSELFPGSAGQHTRNVLGYEWVASSFVGLLRMRRRAFWEGPRTVIPLTNSSASDSTTGITVYNHDDAATGHDNYVEIKAADIDGVLPTPVEIQLTNTYNVTPRAKNIYIGHMFMGTPNSLTHILEAEDANTIVGGTTNAAAAASDGEYVTTAWATDPEKVVFTWALDTTQLEAAAGNHFRVLARFHTAPHSDLKVRIKVLVGSVTVLWEGEQVIPDANSGLDIQDLGIVRLPPYLIGTGTVHDLNLSLYYEREGGGSVDLDFLQLTPLDGYRWYEPQGHNLAHGARLVDDGIENLVYTDQWSTAGKIAHYVPHGRPIMLWPGVAQRMYFLADNNDSVPDIARTFTAKLYYRPRIVTI